MDKESIRKAALSLGADICGFAAAERFSDAPAGFRPEDVLPVCKSVVVFGVALPKGLYTVPSDYLYSYFNGCISVPKADSISFQLARLLESEGGIAVPVPCDGPVAEYDIKTKTKRGILSMKHAAVKAGLGTLGKNTLLLNAAFGNRLTVGLVLTDVVFPSDPPAAPVCLPNCRLCLDNCPVRAIGDGSVMQLPCRENTYVPDTLGFTTVQCNRCRTICPMRDGRQ